MAETSLMLRLHVSNLAGRQLEFDMPVASTIHNLKEMVAKYWFHPPLCQIIIVGTAVTCDADVLVTFCGGNAPVLNVLVVFTLHHVYQCLQDPTPSVRVWALQTLALHAPKGCETTIGLVSKALEDCNAEVREMSIHALLAVAGKGHGGAVHAARGCLLSSNPNVRITALHALLQVSSAGDRSIADGVCALMNDRDLGVRRTTFQTAAHISKTPTLYERFWVSSANAAKLLESGSAIFLDVRDKGSFDASRIPAARHMPGHHMLQLTRREVGGVVVVYSDTGSESSRCGYVARLLHVDSRSKAHRVLRLDGGLNAWKQHGLPVEGDRRATFAGLFLSPAPWQNRGWTPPGPPE